MTSTLTVRPRISVIGAGPAGLMAAETAARAGACVFLFDQMASPARKFLMAGRGGLNLTHSESLEVFLARYGTASSFLKASLNDFSPADLRAWCEGLGEATFVGTSGRVFPASFKASPVLRAWLRRLEAFGVNFASRHRFVGLRPDLSLEFETPLGRAHQTGDAVILALGGASWPRLGSTGEWTEILEALGVRCSPWRAANCGFEVEWSPSFRARFAGLPIKGAAFSAYGRTVRGEAMVSSRGLEGGAVYALSADMRAAIEADGFATLTIDLRPDVPEDQLCARFNRARGRDSLSQRLRKAGGLSPVAIGLLRESGAPLLRDAASLAASVKRLALTTRAPFPLARAISSAGGVALSGVDETMMLKSAPGVFVCGEMLDFEAPTGGYLLQAAFSTGVAAAAGAIKRSRTSGAEPSRQTT